MPPSPTSEDPAMSTRRGSLHSRLEGRGRSLFAEIAGGSMEAVGELYDLAADDLYGLALWRTGGEDDAADVVQEVFARLASQGTKLLDVQEPAAWLLSVTHRAAIDVQRRRTRRREVPESAALLCPVDAGDPGRQMDARRASTFVQTLPAKQREVIYLRHFLELSFREIAELLHIPTFTAASRYRLGLRRLRKLIGENP